MNKLNFCVISQPRNSDIACVTTYHNLRANCTVALDIYTLRLCGRAAYTL